MRNHTPEEIIGITLGLTVVVLGIFTAAQILRALAVSFGRDIRSWWRLRRPAKGWQPRRPRLAERIAKALPRIARRS
jgi:hypothetical protein